MSKILLSIIVLVLIIMGIFIWFNPFNEGLCELRNGRWTTEDQVAPNPNDYYCLLQTSDAGKFCRDSSECDGVCVYVLAQDGLEATGKCSEWPQNGLNCYGTVEDGIAQPRVCP